MKEYNAPFFSLYENLFLILKEEYGEQPALYLFKKIMEKGLKSACDKQGYIKGSPNSFQEVIETRDKNVGLIVKFPIVEPKKIIYQFHTDPFKNLKGIVNHELLDRTYIDFKVKYLLGDDWGYKTTSHFWKDDPYTEFTIEKN